MLYQLFRTEKYTMFELEKEMSTLKQQKSLPTPILLFQVTMTN